MPKISELPVYSGTPSTAILPIVIDGDTYQINQSNFLSDSEDFSTDRANHTGVQAISTITNLQTSLDSLDNSIFTINTRDEFVSTGLSNGIIGELGWSTGGGATYSMRGWELGHPGIVRMSRAATGTGYLYLTWLNGQGISGFVGLTIYACVRLSDITSVTYDFGLASVGALTSGGSKGWIFNSSYSPNWQILHRTSAGVLTYSDSGIAATTGWQILKLTFVDSTTTTGTVKTSVGTSSLISNSGAATTASGDHSINFSITNASGTKYIDIDAFKLESSGITTRL